MGGFTNFPSGVMSLGIPVVPANLFGRTSKAFFVDPVNGSDGNRGTDIRQPLATLSQAHSLCTAGNNDVVYLIGNGLTSGTARETGTLTWSKDSTHLIGICSGNHIAQRARISSASGTTFATMMTVSADGCRFENIHVFQDYNTAATNACLNVTGERHAFVNCHFAGGGAATGADQAGMSSVYIDGDGAGRGENYFGHCVIGLDTVNRGAAASAEIVLAQQTPRNMFENCTILSRTDDTNPLMMKVGASGMDRWCLFKSCLFWNDTVGGGTKMAQMFSLNASAGGVVMLQKCDTFGATAIETSASSLLYISQETDQVADANAA